jgi:hypothetical protein
MQLFIDTLAFSYANGHDQPCDGWRCSNSLLYNVDTLILFMQTVTLPLLAHQDVLKVVTVLSLLLLPVSGIRMTMRWLLEW